MDETAKSKLKILSRVGTILLVIGTAIRYLAKQTAFELKEVGSRLITKE